MTAQKLKEAPRFCRPHVVLLGAGASRAAFPNGDATGQLIPLMDDLVDIVGLQELIDQAGLDIGDDQNFEVSYGEIADQPKYVRVKERIELRIEQYFSNLSLPKEATIYDRLLISLRPSDAILTFNWDPFLFDAYQRNAGAVPLPEIFFLHGNVRIGACSIHDRWGARDGVCPECGAPFAKVPLLYPIRQKNYSSDPHISRAWTAARELLQDAFTMTIFGYGAPVSDSDAVALVRQAWSSLSDREFEHIQIIDIAASSLLHSRWSTFTPTLHYQTTDSFEQSRIARWPRRSCEAVFYPMTEGLPCEDFPLPTTNCLHELHKYVANIAKYERA